MRAALILLVLATPAAAHHETVVVATLPYMTMFALGAGALVTGLWQRWRRSQGPKD